MKIKDIILRLLSFIGIFRIFALLNQNKLIVLMYHGITKNHERLGIEDYGVNHLDYLEFQKQMKYLSKHYNVISADDLRRNVLEAKPLPKRAVLITFDDGYKNNYTAAFPILKSFEFPAIIFVSPGFISQERPLWVDSIIYSLSKTSKENLELRFADKIKSFRIETDAEKIRADKEIFLALLNMDIEARQKAIDSITRQTGCDLSKNFSKYEDYTLIPWENLKEMKDNGIYVGSHGQNHLCLAGLTYSRIQEEINLSTQEIFDRVGEKPLFFAYPWGASYTYNDTVKKALRDKGYICAFTSLRGLNDFSTGIDYFEVKRIGIEAKADFIAFKAAITGLDHFFSYLKEKLKDTLIFRNKRATNR